MKNKLDDLNNYLFAQIERLDDEELKGEALTEEINRSKAITGTAKMIIDNAAVVLGATKFAVEHSNSGVKLPALLGG